MSPPRPAASALLPAGVQHALAALEARILAAFLLFGAGRLAAALGALVLALYGLDRVFEPPAPARLVLLLLALVAAGLVAWRYLLVPLRRRPGPRDLAAIWERNVPELGGCLATTVELLPRYAAGRGPAAGESPELLAAVAREAEDRARQLDPRPVVPMGRAGRSALLGSSLLAVLAVLGALHPREAGIFLRRMAGGAVAWPRQTHLRLLDPYVEGRDQPPRLEETGQELYRLRVARGSVVILRIRAEGVVPDQVLALATGWRRAMRPLGDGTFVLRLPPLREARDISFRGGDDLDDLPLLHLEPGVAPAVVDWRVHVEPPVYTGLPAEDSISSELRVPAGTRLAVTFRTDRPAARAVLYGLQGDQEELAPPPQGEPWRFEVLAERNGERRVELMGPDGFVEPRAAVLRWQALPDTPPRLEFLLPVATWTTVPGGRVPVLVEAEDDHGLAAVALRLGPGDPEEAPAAAGRRRWRRFLLWSPPPPPQDPEGGPGGRFRLEARARDAAEPESAEVEAASPWIELVDPAEAGRRLEETVGRVRERVERLRDRTADLVAHLEGAGEGAPQTPEEETRRILRELDGVQARLEALLLERIYAGLDPGAREAGDHLAALLEQGPPEPGEVVAALEEAPVPLLETAGTLLGLAGRTGRLRAGPGEDLAEALAGGTDPVAPGRRMLAGLDELLESLLAWEDFQSAVRMLRQLLEQQRDLHLRTREAADR